jgi:hypothetical protein
LQAAEVAYMANIDRKNYWVAPQTDANGRIMFPALIPGAHYRIATGASDVIKQGFVATSGKTIDLGKLTIEAPKDE